MADVLEKDLVIGEVDVQVRGKVTREVLFVCLVVADVAVVNRRCTGRANLRVICLVVG